jgi:hypothetical protein
MFTQCVIHDLIKALNDLIPIVPQAKSKSKAVSTGCYNRGFPHSLNNKG